MPAVIERSVTFPAGPSSPSAARRLLRTVLDDCGRPEWRDAAELALSELTTKLRADGTEVLCDFWIDADRGHSGQPVYP